MNLNDYGFAVGNPADVVIIDAQTPEQAVAEIAQPARGIQERPAHRRVAAAGIDPAGLSAVARSRAEGDAEAGVRSSLQRDAHRRGRMSIFAKVAHRAGRARARLFPGAGDVPLDRAAHARRVRHVGGAGRADQGARRQSGPLQRLPCGRARLVADRALSLCDGRSRCSSLAACLSPVSTEVSRRTGASGWCRRCRRPSRWLAIIFS